MTYNLLNSSITYDLLCQTYAAEVQLRQLAWRYTEDAVSPSLTEQLSDYADAKTHKIDLLKVVFRCSSKIPRRQKTGNIFHDEVIWQPEVYPDTATDIAFVKLLKTFETLQTSRYTTLRQIALHSGEATTATMFYNLRYGSLYEVNAMQRDFERPVFNDNRPARLIYQAA